MADKREDILKRLVEIAEAVPGIKTVGRNVANLDDFNRPAIQILDADETAFEEDPRHRSGSSTRRIGMSPEIYICLGGKPEVVGPEINALRAALIKAILTDAQLEAIVGTNGFIRYDGCATGLTRELGIVGEMGVAFTFCYALRPSEL